MTPSKATTWLDPVRLSAGARRPPGWRPSPACHARPARRPSRELERVICRDAGLAHRFLRLADCALYGRRARVRSVRDALARLGAQTARQWALMTVVAGVGDTTSGTARHLLSVGLHRGRMCQMLARQDHDACPDRAFSAGLLSVLPALTHHSLEQLLSQLPVDAALTSALTDHHGREGQILAAILAYEEGQREDAHGDPRLLAAISGIYAEGLLWADENARRATQDA